MAKITISGNQAVITSAFKTEDIVLLKKRNPQALVLKDEKDKPVFAVGVGATGSVAPAGIVFNGSTIPEGYACLSKELPASVNTEAKAKEWVMDEIGLAIVKLNELEGGIAEALAKVEAENTAVESTIGFAQ